MHVSVPQCDVFGYFSIESEIVILIIPVDHYPKALQVGQGARTLPVAFAFGGLCGVGDGGLWKVRQGGRERSKAASEGQSRTHERSPGGRGRAHI